MTLSKIGRLVMAAVATAALGLGMTACGGGTIGYMWVLGTYYNQISGFLIDDYSGNLTAITHSPFSSGGTNPVALVVKPGGRFVFVINSGAGVPAGVAPGTPTFVSTGSAISVFSVGGGGTLTFEQNYFSQGVQPVWAALDSSGNYLYVVDKYSPDYKSTGNGSVTVFSIAGDTGRLTLVPNTSILMNQIPQTWFDVGPNPVMTKIGSGGCLFTLSPGAIYPYSINSGNGQLTTVTTGPTFVGTASAPVNLTSINTSVGSSAASYIFLTDALGNQIFSYTAGATACSLSPVGTTGTVLNLSGALNPVNSLTSSSGKFLYVLNFQSTGTTTNANSTISAYTINTQGQLAPLSDSTNNPYSVGSGPLCLAQDPSSQYIYISNSNDSTVTGKLLDQNRGYLANLSRGSVFPTTMKPSCLVISGNL